MKIAADRRLIFAGDSITDVDRARPNGEGLFNPLGRGYPHFVNALLNAAYPRHNIHVINSGCGGDRVRDLAARWESDIIDRKPDYLSICIGINDVWRQFDSPSFPAEYQVFPEEYERTLKTLIEKTLPMLATDGLILMTPYYIESNRSDAMRARMDGYGAIVKALAAKYGAILVDTQAVFDELLRFRHSSFYAWDRVHPNDSGHAAIARAWLKAVDFEF